MTQLTAARLMGLFILISTSSYLTASNLIAPMYEPDALATLINMKDSISLAAILEFVNSAAIIAAAIVIYPIVKQSSERMAMTYVVIRVCEGLLLLIGAVMIVSLVNVSELLNTVSADNADLLNSMLKVQLRERFYFFQMGMMSLSLGGFLLCANFYQYKLIPRALSALGMVGYFILFVKVVVNFFGIKMGGQIAYIPGALFEFLMPLWLLVKGFDTSLLKKPAAQ